MIEGTRLDLAKYRIEKSQEQLKIAKDNFELHHYGESITKSYYAMFTAARAILALKQLDSKTHKGVIFLFDREYIKTGLISSEYGKYLAKARRQRERADYGDFVIVTAQEAKSQIEIAEIFVAGINKLIKNQTGDQKNEMSKM